MKFKLILLFLISFGVTMSYGQVSFSIIRPQSGTDGTLLSCDAAENYTIRVTNTGQDPLTTSCIFSINPAAKGLYIDDFVTPTDLEINATAFTSLSDHKSLSFSITDLQSMDHADLTVKIFAGYCNDFPAGQSQITIANPFTIDVAAPGQDYTDPGSVSIERNVNNNLSLNFISSGCLNSLCTIKTQPPGNSLDTEFQYVINNTASVSSQLFYLNFRETKVGAAYYISDVEIYVVPSTHTGDLTNPYHAVSNPVPFEDMKLNQNNNDFILNGISTQINLPVDYVVVIKEKVKINGCVADVIGESYPIITWGCKPYERCDQSGAITTRLTFSPKAKIEFMPASSDYVSNLVCYDGGSYNRHAVFKNTGKISVADLKFNFQNSNTGIFVPKGAGNEGAYSSAGVYLGGDYSNDGIYLEVIKNGVSILSEVNWDRYTLQRNVTYREANMNTGDVVLPSHMAGILSGINAGPSTGNGIMGSIAYHSNRYVNVIATPNEMTSIDQTKYSFTGVVNENLNCIASPGVDGKDVVIVTQLIIDQYYDGEWKDLNLGPEDQVIIRWREYNCCKFNDGKNVNGGAAGPNIPFKYNDACNGQSFHYWENSTLINGSAIEGPNPTSTAGDPDQCLETFDGNVERISSKFDFYRFEFRDFNQYVNTSAKVVFRLYLEKGYDLDLSLDKANEIYPFIDKLALNNYTANPVVNNGSGCQIPLCSCSTATASAESYYLKMNYPLAGVDID